MLKYALVLNNDPIFYIQPMHQLFVEAAHRIDCIILVPGFENSALKKRFLHAAMKIYGPAYALKHLYRFLKGSFWSFSSLAAHHDIPLYKHKSVNEPAFKKRLKNREILTVLSMTTQIYRQDILSLSGAKFYNFHAGLLPANKGLLPIFWAYMNDEPQGVTIHEINSKIDEGPILFQQRVEGAEENSVLSVTDALINNSTKYIIRAINHLDSGLPPAPLHERVQASYGPIPNRQQLATYLSKKLKQQKPIETTFSIYRG